MKPTAAQVEERLPVWEALSEFFLDTELQPEDHERIAQTLADSPYSEKQFEGILAHEVCPVCKWNMLCVAGEWAGFDRDWLKEGMTPRYGKRPFWDLGFRQDWMFSHHWRKVRSRIRELRSHKVGESAIRIGTTKTRRHWEKSQEKGFDC